VILTVSAVPLLSYVVSPRTATSTVATLDPAAKVTVPEAAVKSSPAVAVPVVSVSYETVTSELGAESSVSEKERFLVPVSPSVIVGSV
jgi:hypothetical protein